MTTVEKIRATRDAMYEKYMRTHKKADVRGFHAEIIEGKKCDHAKTEKK